MVNSISFETFFCTGNFYDLTFKCTTQIGSVAFPAGLYTSPQLHPFHRLFEQDGHQDSSSPSL